MAFGCRYFLFGVVLLAIVLAVVDAFSTTPQTQRSAPPPSASQQHSHTPAWALLEQHAGSRLERLTHLPRTAEAFLHGQVRIVSLLHVDPLRRQCTVQFVDTTTAATAAGSEDSSTIDFSQLITVWREDHATDVVQALSRKRKQQQQRSLDPTFHALYQSRVGRGRRVELTKKMIRQLEEESNDDADKDVINALRSVQKTGGGGHMPRLVDSWDAAHAVWDGSFGVGQRCIAAQALGMDAADGGRFKRFPCVWVAADTTTTDTNDDPTVLFLNGGWLVVDHCVRAGTEARKLVSRQGKVQSASDERIIRRLECLALGETLQRNDNDDAKRTSIEVDVRETLKTLQLSVTAEGATDALMQMGLWSSGDSTGFAAAIQPWPSEILQAAKQYDSMLAKAPQPSSSMDVDETLGIIDLTQFPCVSIDSPKTRFRDDAIGVRSRASTGRKVHNEDSKWEVLIHIADVSDIYTKPNRWNEKKDVEALSALQDAAMRRGSSRYDLAHGPLHLLPPTVLEQLTLNTSQRAVTCWVYIDQRTGKILDAGVERTTISVPTAYSYESATRVLSGKAKEDRLLPLLQVVSKVVSKWKSNHMRQNEGARRRSQRLAANHGMKRNLGHILVDDSLDLYSHVASGLMVRAKVPVPKSLAASTSRGGRFATGPLRRAIDGQAQRQLLAVMCGYGQPLTLEDCKDISRRAVESTNAIATVRSSRQQDRYT